MRSSPTAGGPGAAGERDLAVEIEAEAAWTFRFRRGPAIPGDAEGVEIVERQPPALGEELTSLFHLAGAGLDLDANGQLSQEGRQVEAAMQALARKVGAAVTGLLPEGARKALTEAVGGSATLGPALFRLRVTGTRANEALLLPWELLEIHDSFPVAQGSLHLLREAYLEGAEGLPENPPPLSVVSHISAPAGDGMVELNLEEAAYRMARALDPLRERTRFTELGSLDDLKSAARAVNPVLLHFAGHGGPGELYFEDDEGGPDAVSVNQLLIQLSAVMGGRLPLALWLSCCYSAGDAASAAKASPPRRPKREGAEPDSSREWGVLAPESRSVAADLHRHGIPQILGYFGPVPDDLAVAVDRALFEGLLETGSSLEATRRARLAAQAEIPGRDGKVRFPLGWTLLGLYHRGPDRPLTAPVARGTKIELEGLEPEALLLEGVEALRHGFLGRRRLLAELRKLRREGQRALGLYGLGGLGKTATLTRFASLLTGGGPGWEEQVIVIPASEVAKEKRSGESFQPFAWLRNRIYQAVSRHPLCPKDWEQALAGVDEKEEPEERGAALARQLLRAAGDGILYLDNAETLQAEPEGVVGEKVPWAEPGLAAFFRTLCREAAGNATVLLTTRYRPADTPGRWLEIRPLSEGEIFRMTGWQRALRRLPPELRDELAEERLAGHPRAVRFVDALVQEIEEGRIDDGHYGFRPTDDAEQVRSEVLEPALEGLPKKIDQHLALASLLGGLGAGPRALLGECCAIGLPVPLEVVGALGEGAQILKARGLLTRYEGATEGWAVHPFVQEAVAKMDDAPEWTVGGRGVLGQYWEQRGSEDSSPGELSEALEHLVAGEAWEAAVGVAVTLSGAYRHFGWVRSRLELLEGLSEVPWSKEQRSRWVYELGRARQDIGDYAGCEVAMRESLALAEAVGGGRQNAQAGSSLHGLANVLVSQGRYVEAEAVYRDSIRIKEEVYGTRQHASVAASLSGLANVLVSQGRYVEAEAAYRDSIRITEEVYDTRQHAEVAASLHGLANVLVRQGRYVEAEAAYRDSIRIKEEVYGTRQHASVAASLSGLANVLVSQGRYVEAEAAYRDSIRITEEVYDTRQHAEVAASLHGLANVLLQRKDLAGAISALEEVVAIEEEVFGSRRTPNTVPTLSLLAQVHLGSNRHAEALSFARDAWEGAVEHQAWLLALDVGPIFFAALGANSLRDQAKQFAPQFLGLLTQFPRTHPARLRAVKMLGLDNDALPEPDPNAEPEGPL